MDPIGKIEARYLYDPWLSANDQLQDQVLHHVSHRVLFELERGEWKVFFDEVVGCIKNHVEESLKE